MIVPVWLLGQGWKLLFIYDHIDQLHKLGTIAGIHLFSQGVQVRLLLLLLLTQVLKARNGYSSHLKCLAGFKDNLDIVCALLKDNSLAHFVSRGLCLLAGGYEALSYNRLKKRPMGFKIHLKRVVAFLDCIPSFLLCSCVSLSSPLFVADAVPTVAERGIELKVSLIVAERELELEVC